ncbi:hypothetical protein J1614_000134 [Plenodomus biglobosus]|nr:hypothetical protein J1614_000134 [Plenodomus biglobosus]
MEVMKLSQHRRRTQEVHHETLFSWLAYVAGGTTQEPTAQQPANGKTAERSRSVSVHNRPAEEGSIDAIEINPSSKLAPRSLRLI